MVNLPTEIKEKKLLITEGADAYYFAIQAYQSFGASNVQVLNFGGIDDLGLYLKQLTLLSSYENVETIVIARDAESNPDRAIDSIITSLKKVGLPVPKKPFEFEGIRPRVAFMLFPGLANDEKSLMTGTLEDLCLETIEDLDVLGCVDQYIECLNSNGKAVKHPHKSRLHAYLAGINNFVGLKVGEAAKAGAWNWNHQKLETFKRTIASM